MSYIIDENVKCYVKHVSDPAKKLRYYRTKSANVFSTTVVDPKSVHKIGENDSTYVTQQLRMLSASMVYEFCYYARNGYFIFTREHDAGWYLIVNMSDIKLD